MAAWAKCTVAEPARCGSEEDVVEGVLRMGAGLVDEVDVKEGLNIEFFWFWMVSVVLATAHLYFGGQSKARWPI